MYKVYVDDENQVWRLMEPGMRWNGSRLEWREDWEEEDQERGEEGEVRMMREVQKLANSVETDIQLTVDTPSQNKDGKLPVLDLKMWIETRRTEHGQDVQEIMYQFYEKEMVAPRVINKKSALPDRVKHTTLTQEVIRKMRNTSKGIRDKMKSDQMSKFAMKLMLYGYDKKS